MTKYNVTAYMVIQHSVEVEAEDEDDARDIGWDMITNGEYTEGDFEYQDEIDVWESED
jgi:hypothetical protein